MVKFRIIKNNETSINLFKKNTGIVTENTTQKKKSEPTLLLRALLKIAEMPNLSDFCFYVFSFFSISTKFLLQNGIFCNKVFYLLFL